MTKKMIVGFAMVSLSLVACAAQSGPEGVADEAPAANVTSALDIKETPGSGQSCHADGAGVTNGTMTDNGWCCGVSTCSDKDTCGAEYGHLVSSCAACDWFKCDPGASRGTKPRPELFDFTDVKAELVYDGPGLQTPYAPPTKAGTVRK